jgi:hypothetical protein
MYWNFVPIDGVIKNQLDLQGLEYPTDILGNFIS